MSPKEELMNAEAFIEKLGLKCKVLTLEDFRAAHAEANGLRTEQQPVAGQSGANALAAQLHAAVAAKDATKVSLASGNSLGGADFPQADTATDADALLAKLAEDDRAFEIRDAALAWKADANVEACVGELLRIVQNNNSEHVQCPLRGGLNIYAPGDVAIMRGRRISVVSRHQENVKECTAKIAQEDLEISEQAVALAKKAELERADKALLSRLSPQLTQKRRSAPRPRTEANVKADAATDAWLRSAYGRLDGIDQIAAITKDLRRKQSSDELRTDETTARPDQLKVNMAAKHAFSHAYANGVKLWATGEIPRVDLPSGLQPALRQQVGGNHYKDLVIQPVEYCQRNGLGFCESSVVKYVSRYKAKNGVEDLRKARHFLDLLIEMCEKDVAGATYCIKPIN